MAAAEVRAVLDTSVLVSEASRRDLQEAAALGLYRAYWSPWIIAELNRVLTLQWLRRTGSDMGQDNLRRLSRAAKEMMGLLLQTIEVVNPRPPYSHAWPDLADTDDLPVWAAARAANAQYVVSDNSHDYPPLETEGRRSWLGVEYISATGFLDHVLRRREQ